MHPFEAALLRAFVAHGVRFVVIGGSAVHLHGYRQRPRKDLDLLIDRDEQLEQCRLAALKAVATEFGHFAFLPTMGTCSFRGVHIDLLPRMHGLYGDDPFVECAWAECEAGSVPVISLRHLLAGKRAMWRPQDAEDLRAMSDCPIEAGRCGRCGAGRLERDAWRPLSRELFERCSQPDPGLLKAGEVD